MLKIKISADFERRLRTVDSTFAADYRLLTSELIRLIDVARAEAAAKKEKTTGIGWSTLLSLFRAEFGPSLAVPITPSNVWISRQCRRAQEIGLDNAGSIRQLADAVRKRHSAPYELEWLLRSGPRLLVTSGREEGSKSTTPIIGRAVLDD